MRLSKFWWMTAMTNDASDIATDALSLIGERGFLNELAQVRAHATLTALGTDTSQINWTFRKRRLERNGTSGIFSIESAARLDPDAIDDSPILQTAALRLAQLWEALAVTSPEGSAAALMTAAVSYEVAGYQANAATLAERLTQSDLDWSMAPMVTDFLRRRLLSVVARERELESAEPVVPDLPTFVTAAADRLLGRALTSASLYLLGGRADLLSDARGLLERAREAYSRVGRLAEANLCFAASALVPLIERRTTWALIADSSDSEKWRRYLRLLGRGTSGRPVDARSLSELWPSQVSALRAGLLSSRNSMVLRLPTSAGKTRIAEIAIAHQLTEDPTARCLYVAPYRALVSEIEERFINLFADLGVAVSSFVGAYDGDLFEQQLAQDSNLLIATPERLDLLERVAPEFFDRVKLVILDEGQVVGDRDRGVRYELLLSRLRVRLPETRFLVMSAVVPNQTLEDFAAWLQSPPSAVMHSDWRPSIQRVSRFQWQGRTGVIRYEPSDDLDFRGAFLHGVVRQREFEHVSEDTGHTRRPRFPNPNNKSETAVELALHFSNVGPVLIFCPQTNYVESVGAAFTRRFELSSLVGEETSSRFSETDKPSSRSAAEWLGSDHKVSQLLRRGIGVHHGRLPDAVRSAIELDFRERRLSILVATTTLAQGVNLPVRTVIIHSSHRHQDGVPTRVPEREYWNIAGRAGRAGFETEGTIVHLTFNAQDERAFRFYQQRRDSLQPIESVLFNLLRDLKESRIASHDATRLLNPQVLALMTEESPEQFETTVTTVVNHSLAAVQASRLQLTIEPIADLMKVEGDRVRTQVPDKQLLQAYRETGLSSDSCVTVSELLRDYPNVSSLLQSESNAVPRPLIEFLVHVVSAIPEFAPNVEPPVDYVEATSLWLAGETVSEIERRLLGGIAPDSQFSRFAGQFFVHTLPWASSVMVLLAKREFGLGENDLGPITRSLPSMIRFGVPMPEAAWCMNVGISSRQAAIEMAADYRAGGGETNFAAFREWFGTMELPDLRARYSLQGPTLETAHRAVTQFGASLLSSQSFDVATTLPMEVELVGLHHGSRWAVARSLRGGESLTLLRELDNAYDRNAILVLRGDSELGYIPRLTAQLLAPEIDAGLRLRADVVSAQHGQVLVRVEPL